MKTRASVEGCPAIDFESTGYLPCRMLVTGAPTWRELSLSCRVQPMQSGDIRSYDLPFGERSRAGLVFRMETVRHYYVFCMENQSRLVLCRRSDDEWTELAAFDAGRQAGILTLRVMLDTDGISGDCPELGVTLHATDSAIPSGLAGFVSIGTSRLFDLDISMTPGQERENQRRAKVLAARTAKLSSHLPDEEEAGVISLAGDRRIITCHDFCVPGRNDLLFATSDGLQAETWEGAVLWRHPEPLDYIVLSRDTVEGRRLVYGLAGERGLGNAPGINVTGAPMSCIVHDTLLVLDGASGNVLARTRLPDSPRPDQMRNYDLSFGSGRLSGEHAVDILVREWRVDWGGGGEMLWAFDGNLNPRWERKVHPGYGHHNAVHFIDINGDGRDEVLAGGNLLSADGEPIWRHDQGDAFFETLGGQHYDAVVAGSFAGDPALDPLAFLIGGSAGVYIVDALNGRTRARHRVGHAQWGLPCKVRDDLPGVQVMVGTRWGNYGILTLFSGRGDRLWSIQPDFVLQGCAPVQWTPEGPQHIWCCMSARAMGLYDGYGRLVKPLNKIRALYGEGTKKPVKHLRRTPGGTDLLGLRVGDQLRLFGPASNR